LWGNNSRFLKLDTETRCPDDYILFELLFSHLEDEKERSQLQGLLAWWRQTEMRSCYCILLDKGWLARENKRSGAFVDSEHVSQVLAYSSEIVLFYE